jgi:hypothetical protein
MPDHTELLIEIHATVARMDERSKSNAEKLDTLTRTCETHTALFDKHGERIGALESAKAKVLAVIAGVSIGGSAVGSKLASLLSGGHSTPPPH